MKLLSDHDDFLDDTTLDLLHEMKFELRAALSGHGAESPLDIPARWRTLYDLRVEMAVKLRSKTAFHLRKPALAYRALHRRDAVRLLAYAW